MYSYWICKVFIYISTTVVTLLQTITTVTTVEKVLPGVLFVILMNDRMIGDRTILQYIAAASANWDNHQDSKVFNMKYAAGLLLYMQVVGTTTLL